MLHMEWMETPLGDLIAIADDTHLRVLSFRDRAKAKGVEADFARHLGLTLEPSGNGVTGQVAAEIASYFDGRTTTFETPLAPAGSVFEQAVWQELLRVGAGTTCSYGDIARKVGGVETSRAVGRANNANPLVIVIPCHRCIGADGSMTGYGAGLWRKKWLLRHEAEMCPVGLFAR